MKRTLPLLIYQAHIRGPEEAMVSVPSAVPTGNYSKISAAGLRAPAVHKPWQNLNVLTIKSKWFYGGIIQPSKSKINSFKDL